MSRVVCPKCGNIDVSWIRDDTDYTQYICLSCKQGFCYPPKTLFDQLTASPEVLAEKLVFITVTAWGETVYISTIIRDGMFKTREEALAATVAKLNEVAE